MRHRFLGSAILSCCAILAAAPLRSQSPPPRQRPYTAISRKTVYSAEPGKPEVIKEIIRTTEARDSHGRRFTSAGSNVPQQFRYDVIRDVVSGRLFEVNRQQKVAYFSAIDRTSSADLSNSEMPTVEINGVPCLQGPLRSALPDGRIEVRGTLCVSPELGNLVVHDDHRASFGGENVRIVVELENLQFDVEPPQEWFRVPADFRLVPGRPGRPAQTK